MSFFRDIAADLRVKRLWPVALVLVVALIAVPVLLAKSSPPVRVANLPAPAPSSTLPVVTAEAGPSHTHPSGLARDPFGGAGTQTGTATTASSTASSAASSSSSKSSSSTGSSSSGSSGTGSSSAGSSGTATTPVPIPPPPAGAKRAPSSLSPQQTYEVSLAVSNASGGLNTIDPLERLSVLPNQQQPLLVELGVLKGGGRVLFALLPGAVVTGPGSCTPGPIDCQILSLAPGQDETLETGSSSGTNLVALFAVTAIKARDLGSDQAAFLARRHASATGRELLAGSRPGALSLFRYQPDLGAVVDQRNLSIGG